LGSAMVRLPSTPTEVLQEELAMFPFDTVPVDIVPATIQVVLVPLCEGVVVGIVLGAAVLFVMKMAERLLAQPTDTAAAEVEPTVAGNSAPRPALGARTLPTPTRHPRATGAGTSSLARRVSIGATTA
jgi:hypothetical protein